MLINNLGSLKAELARYMFHQRFAPDYDTAIQNFEAVCNRRLRTRMQEHTVYLTLNSAQNFAAGGIFTACDVPPDYLLWRAVNFTGGKDLSGASVKTPYVELDYVHPAYLRTTSVSSATAGDSKVFTIEDGSFYPMPPHQATAAYEFMYYRKIDTILDTQDGDNANNWLIGEHPDIYLFGALFELFVLGRNSEAGQAYKQMRDEKMAELVQLSALTTGATSSQVRGEGSALGSGGEYF